MKEKIDCFKNAWSKGCKDSFREIIVLVKQQNPKAQNRLVKMFEYDVQSVATGIFLKGWTAYSSLGVDDLVQEGSLALLDAAEKYEFSGASFKSYAMLRVRGAMIDALRRTWTSGRFLIRQIKEVEEVERALSQKLLRAPSRTELREGLAEPLQKNLDLILGTKTFSRPTSIHADNNFFEKDIEVPYETSPEKELLLEEENRVWKSFLDTLSVSMEVLLKEEEVRFIQLRFFQGLHFEEIGDILGFSESRACQIEIKVLAKLKRYLQSCYPEEVQETLENISRIGE